MNSDTLGRIALFSGDPRVLRALRAGLCPKLYASFYRPIKKLIYGEVQSGKTAQIIAEIERLPMPVLIIIQNSKSVQNQYEVRLREAGIDFQLVHKNTSHLNAKVTLLMNNPSQLVKYTSLNPPNVYAILLDESDITQRNPLRANASVEIHVTATPFRYTPNTFDEVQFIDKHPDYYGLDKVQLHPIPNEINYFTIASEFMASQGILLINTFTRIEQMKTVAMQLSTAHPSVPVILLTTNKGVYVNRVFTPIHGNSMSGLLDRYTSERHVIIVANRMATRGISFSNSAHTTHITHQVSKATTITGFLQKCRILGIYQDLPQLNLYIESKFVRRVEKYKRAIADREAIRTRNQKVGGKVLYRSMFY
jgi:hypothetical protein